MPCRRLLPGILALSFIVSCSGDKGIAPSSSKGKKNNRFEDSAPYGYESGIVEFQTRKPSSLVEETVYFADWGRLEMRKETFRSPMGNVDGPARHQITLINSRGVFTYQVEAGTGLKSPLPAPAPFAGFDELAAGIGQEAAVRRLRELGVRKLTNEMILGFPCHVFRLRNGSYWVHRGLVLRSRLRIGEYFSERNAVRFVPNITVDRGRFRFPDGVDPETFLSVRDLLKKGEQRKGLEKMRY